ncbi:hypothetical protein KIN20_007406 [Parelaphostrongylus tenuis]|uniref:Uncharacterized protein n=1 Tax=Parelaphostrongylus tenuis TaxID=148309 RepID=A0AAD5M5G9_PARTN|nr:hypothetical protein KIN20_007406 [Parelaphostrongylus tenuis]
MRSVICPKFLMWSTQYPTALIHSTVSRRLLNLGGDHVIGKRMRSRADKERCKVPRMLMFIPVRMRSKFFSKLRRDSHIRRNGDNSK